MFAGIFSSNGAPPIDASAPVAGLSARIEPSAVTPPTGFQVPAGDWVQVPPVRVMLLARNRWVPSQTPPDRMDLSPSAFGVPICACHTSAPLSRRYARNHPSLLPAPTRGTPPPVKRMGLDP